MNSHKDYMIKRTNDLLLSLLLPCVFLAPMILIGFIIKFTSKGPAIYWSDRIGKNNIVSIMPKFRSMLIDTPTLAIPLIKGDQYCTKFGYFLRKTSLDKLPQLWSIFIGNMSFVGPRSALFNQEDLIELRTKYGIHNIKPGLTGCAQINERDSLNIYEKVKLDYFYLENVNLFLDLKFLFITFFSVFNANNISH